MPTANELYDLAVDLRDRATSPGRSPSSRRRWGSIPASPSATGCWPSCIADLAESDKAIAHAKKVVELEPDDAFSYTALSVIYQRCGRIPEAEHAKAMAWQKQMGYE